MSELRDTIAKIITNTMDDNYLNSLADDIRRDIEKEYEGYIKPYVYDGTPMTYEQAYEVSKATGAKVISKYQDDQNDWIRWDQERGCWVGRDGDETMPITNDCWHVWQPPEQEV